MTLAKTIKFSDFRVLVGDGDTPEVFSAPCAFMARAFNRNKTFQEVSIPDCTDEDLPGWVNRDPLTKSWGVTGDGMMDEGSIAMWDNWFLDAAERSVTILITKSDVTNIQYSGKGHLQTLTYQANRAERLMFSIEIVGDGPLSESPPVLLEAREGEAEPKAKAKAKAKEAA